MSLIYIIGVLIVVGVVLWLINLIPMASPIKAIINIIVIIFVVLWLLQIFGILGHVADIRIK